MNISQFGAAILLTATLALAEDPFVGTWKLDPEKTKAGPGAPASWKTAISFKVEVIGPNQHHITAFSPDGKVTDTSDNIFDGKERQNAQRRLIKFIRIDQRHVRETAKGTKGTSVTDSVVSNDGKTMTETMTGTGPGTGRPLEGEVLVWRKQ
jgi:hypothetical protein